MKSAIAKGKESKTSCQQSEQAKEDDRQKITATIPPKSNTKDPLACDYSLYKERHLVECFFQKLKWFRRIATRYDTLDSSFLSFVYLASIMILLK